MLVNEVFIAFYASATGVTVRRKAHELVFAAIHFKSAIACKCSVEKAHGMGKPHFFQDRNAILFTEAYRRCRPFADTIDGEYRGALEGRWIKGARSVGEMMLEIGR